MCEVFDAFWRAVVSALHPKVLLWSLLPLLLAGTAVFAGGWYFWEDAVSAVRASLESWALVEALLHWLDAVGGQDFRAVIAPLLRRWLYGVMPDDPWTLMASTLVALLRFFATSARPAPKASA